MKTPVSSPNLSPEVIVSVIRERFPAYVWIAESFYEKVGQNLCLRALYDSLHAPELTADEALEIKRTYCETPGFSERLVSEAQAEHWK